MAWNFYDPTHIVFGSGSLSELPILLSTRGFRKVLVASGSASAKAGGHLSQVRELLAGFGVSSLEGIEPNPSVETAQRGLDLCRSERFDAVVGLGGGSVLDCAKLFASLAGNEGAVRDYFDGRREVQRKGIPFIALPTTAGTGSEVTKYSVLTDHATSVKKSVRSDLMYPEIAIVDPKLTLTAPAAVTASTGLDAFSQGIEPYWSTKAAPVCDHYAEYVIRAVPRILSRLVSDLGNLSLREQMSYAALMSGLAISNVGTTSCHAISYPLTSRFGIAHGHAVALTLGAMLEFNDGASPKIGRILELFGVNSAKEGRGFIERLITSCGLSVRLRDFGVKESDLPMLVEESFTPNMAFNPRKVEKTDLLGILKSIL